jgi:hypothetical protein
LEREGDEPDPTLVFAFDVESSADFTTWRHLPK